MHVIVRTMHGHSDTAPVLIKIYNYTKIKLGEKNNFKANITIHMNNHIYIAHYSRHKKENQIEEAKK